MKTTSEIIREQIGISIEASQLTPMDKGECQRCMMVYLDEYKAMAHQTMLDAVRALKCCGNCFYMDIIQDKGGVCTCGNGEIPCDKCGYCDDWKIDKRE